MYKYKLSDINIRELQQIVKKYELDDEFIIKHYELCGINKAFKLNKSPKYLCEAKDILHLLTDVSILLKEKLTYYVPNYRESFNRAEYIRNNIHTPRFKMNAENQEILSEVEMRDFRILLLITDNFHNLYNDIQSLLTPMLIKESIDKNRIRLQKIAFRRSVYQRWFI